ncbi:MAG: Rqc2 family fibronectin-binding protein, partial [Armatimonadota bacterium]
APEGLSPDELVKAFTGISPFAANEIAEQGFEAVMRRVREADFEPVLLGDDAGRTIGFYPFPVAQHPAENQYPRDSVNLTADLYYGSALPRQALEQVRAELLGRLRREIEAREATVGEMESGIRESAGAERLKEIGELLLGQIHAVAPEASSATLIDWYGEGGEIAVPLDPAKNAQENAEAYFRKYRKAVSGREALAERLPGAKEEIDALKAAQDAAEKAEAPEDVRKITASLTERGLLHRQPTPTERAKPEFEGFKVHKTEREGFELLVGGNSEANEYLVKIARPNDWWVHVKAAPSAHVIIRTKNKPDAVPRSVLYAAAELAAKSSDARHSSLVPVDYTLRKFVRKQKGGGPGKVLYERERTLYITPG